MGVPRCAGDLECWERHSELGSTSETCLEDVQFDAQVLLRVLADCLYQFAALGH